MLSAIDDVETLLGTEDTALGRCGSVAVVGALIPAFGGLKVLWCGNTARGLVCSLFIPVLGGL